MHNYNTMKRYALLAAACIATLGAAAQTNLSKEITVEKDYVPVERKATKQNVLPSVQKNAADLNATLSYSDWAMPSPVPTKIPTMAPYGYQTTKNYNLKKGYASLGVGSQLNIMGNAGYSLLNDESHELGIWLQHNSTWMGKNRALPGMHYIDSDPVKQKFNDNTLGIDYTSHFYEGVLTINGMANIDAFNYFSLYPATNDISYRNPEFTDQTFTQFAIKSGWQSRQHDRKYTYGVNFAFSHGGFSKNVFEDFGALKENNFRVKLNADYLLKDNLKAGAIIDFEFANYNKSAELDIDTWKIAQRKDNNIGLLKLTPFIRYQREDVLLQIGLNADVSINSGTAFRISPNVKAEYEFASGFGLFIDLQGGKFMNNLWRMKALDRYVNPSFVYNSSFIPLDLEAGFNIGGFAGFEAKLFGGFASYKDMMLPTYPLSPAVSSANYDISEAFVNSATLYRGIDLSGWKAGIELGYKYRSLVDAKARFTYSPQDNDSGCLLGIDRPEYVIDAAINVNPIDKLSVRLGYNMRGNRNVYSLQYVNGEEYWEKYDLHNVMDLNIGASYRILNNLTVFVDAHNLMNKDWWIMPNFAAQKLNVMGGLSVQF